MDPVPILINPKDIEFDRKNPRGENKQQIEDDEEFHKLRDSIKDYTILVPLIVRKNHKGTKPFILIDGERRLRAALLKQEKLVPAHIVEKGEYDARVLAYQIHMVRKDWNKAAQVRALKELKEGLLKKEDGLDERQINKLLLKITRLKKHDFKEQLTLLKYDDKTVRDVHEGKLAYSYLIQIEDSFISVVKREFPKLVESYTEPKLRKILVNKAKNLKLGNTRYLMDHFRKLFKDKTQKTKLKNSIKKFLNNPEENICDAVKKLEEKKATAKKQSQKKKSTKKETKKQPEDDKAGTVVPGEIDHKKKLFDFEKILIENSFFDLLFNNMKDSIKEFEKRTGMIFDTEKKLQDYIYSILRSLFTSVEFEDPTEKMCGTSNRSDFVLKEHKIIIEIKYVKDAKHAKLVDKELAIDFPRYKNSKYGNKIINYIYDPNNYIANHALFIKQLKKLLSEANHYIQ